jgi:hypothetical protein
MLGSKGSEACVWQRAGLCEKGAYRGRGGRGALRARGWLAPGFAAIAWDLSRSEFFPIRDAVGQLLLIPGAAALLSRTTHGPTGAARQALRILAAGILAVPAGIGLLIATAPVVDWASSITWVSRITTAFFIVLLLLVAISVVLVSVCTCQKSSEA